MKVWLPLLVLVPAFGQQPADNSVLDVKPGEEALKNKDIWEGTGFFHPFRRTPRYFLQDQKAIWTSPFHTSKSNLKWWIVFGAAGGALVATDQYTSRHAPNNSTLVHFGTDASYLGSAYSLIPLSGGFYLLGTAAHSEKFRESGLLSMETLFDTALFGSVLREVADRARPYEGNGKGRFESSNKPRWNSSFPSGHAMSTMAIASVFAHEYPHKWWVKVLAYGYAGGVVAARLAANQHFPGDVVVGGAMGWFIGDYVYGKRHNPELDGKQSGLRRVLAHVHVGE